MNNKNKKSQLLIKMYKKPLKHGKTTESQYAYDAKIVYCKAKFKDEYNTLTVKEFANNFETWLTKVDFEWQHKNKDGSLRRPSYKTIINKWFHQNKWEECSKDYAQDIIGPQKEQALLIYDKKFLKDTIHDFQLIDNLRERIDFLLEAQESNPKINYEYRIAKLEETITSVWHRIRERLDLDKEPETEGNEETQRMEPVDLLSDDFMKRELDYLDEVWGVTRK